MSKSSYVPKVSTATSINYMCALTGTKTGNRIVNGSDQEKIQAFIAADLKLLEREGMASVVEGGQAISKAA